MLEQRINAHLEEAHEQQRLIELTLERLEAFDSTTENLVGRADTIGDVIGDGFSSEEVIKGKIAGYAFENMEIASYSALIAAAEYVGDPEGKRVFEQIKAQKEHMVTWLSENMRALTHEFLRRADSLDHEKH